MRVLAVFVFLICSACSSDNEGPLTPKDAEAQYNLGRSYGSGDGVPQDYAEAAKWYRLSAEQGYGYAQLMLGGLYYRGRGVPQDYAEAAKWYRLAAEQGDVGTQLILGALYRDGQGVPQDYVEAHKWFSLAAASGGELAKKARDRLVSRMTPAQIAEAQKLASEWMAARSK